MYHETTKKIQILEFELSSYWDPSEMSPAHLISNLVRSDTNLDFTPTSCKNAMFSDVTPWIA